MTEKNTEDGWSEWRRFVLKELERLNLNLEGQQRRIDDLREAMTILKTKASVYGAIAGIVVAVTVQIIVKFVH